MRIVTLLYRNVKWRFHNKLTIVMTALQPILWLVLYSAIASSTMQHTGIENYTAFMLPGLIVLISFSTCSSSGIMNYLMKSDGSFYRILIAPLTRSSIVLAQLLEAVLCTFLEVSILIVLSMLFSVSLSLSPLEFLIFVLLIFLTSFFMAGLSYGISMLLPNEVIYETVMNAIVLPLFFLSNALFPTTGCTGFLRAAINLNPLTHMIDALRSLMLYGRIDMGNLTAVLLLFILMGGLSFLWACRQLKRKTNL